MPEKIQIQWIKFEKRLKKLEKIAAEKCYKPTILLGQWNVVYIILVMLVNMAMESILLAFSG